MTGMDATGVDVSPDERIQVVEFTLGADRYCVSIDQVAELVHMRELTAVPDSPEHVKGVMDLRGKTTRVIDPRVVLDTNQDGPRKRVIVFDDGDGDQGDVGWVVDEVNEVLTVDGEQIDTDTDGETVLGLIKDDEGQFTIWLDPDRINR